MKTESLVVAELWDLVRDYLPANRKLEIAIAFLRTFEEYGFEQRDMQDVVDEDPYLSRAFNDLYADETEEEESDYDDFDEED